VKHISSCLSWLYHIFFKKTGKTYLQFLRYAILGNISNVFDFACLYVLTEFAGFHYTISASISFIVGVLINYIINVLWIFNRKEHHIHIEITLVILISFVGLCLNVTIIYILVEYANIHYIITKAISAFIVMFWNFYTRKKWVFKQ